MRTGPAGTGSAPTGRWSDRTCTHPQSYSSSCYWQNRKLRLFIISISIRSVRHPEIRVHLSMACRMVPVTQMESPTGKLSIF
jgi:hypothetical protein